MTGLAIMAKAGAADYTRDPTRWGSAEIAAHFPEFEHVDVRTSGAVIRLRHGGSGPPLLLVHGPEGGLSPQEEQALLAQDYLPVTLGPRVLRAETAAIAALAAIALAGA